MQPPDSDLRSSLPRDLLTAHGTHRYYSSELPQTCAMVARLTERRDPVFAIESIYRSGFRSSLHAHDRGQISYVREGMISVISAEETLIIPPGHAVWIPPHMAHQLVASGHVCVLSAYAAEDSWIDLPADAVAFQVSDLFEPLIRRVIARQLLGDEGAVYNALLLLLHEEVRTGRRLTAAAPMPADPRLRRVCEYLLADPMAIRSKDALARHGNMSSRTMTRLFQAELNMTYSAWLQQALIVAAIGRLAQGQPIANVAFDLGYTSPSAFTAMFRRRVGQNPSAFARGRGIRVSAPTA